MNVTGKDLTPCLYMSNAATNQIDVFSVDSGTFLTPLPVGLLPVGIALTPDGSKLLVANYGDRTVTIMDPENPANAVSVLAVDSNDHYYDPRPVRVVATSTGKAFISITRNLIGCVGQLRELDITTLTVTARRDVGIQCMSQDIMLASSPNGSTVLIAVGDNSGGEIATWNAQTDNFHARALNCFIWDADITDASGPAVNTMFLDNQQRVKGIRIMLDMPPDYQLGLPGSSGPFESPLFGEKLHPSGNLLYVPTNKGINIIDAHQGTFRMKIFFPDPPAYTLDALTIDETGKKIFYITGSGGLKVIELPSVPLGIGELQPSIGSTAGGTTVLIRGSGFTLGTSVMFGAQKVTASFVDANTLSVRTPAMPSGSARVTVTNAGGEQYYLDAAFHFAD